MNIANETKYNSWLKLLKKFPPVSFLAKKRKCRQYLKLQRQIETTVKNNSFNPKASLDISNHQPGWSSFRWFTMAGEVKGIAGVRRDPCLEELSTLLDFAARGGKLIYLPMYAGLPSAENVNIYSAVTYGTNKPAPHLQAIPHLEQVDGDLLPLGRFFPTNAKKKYDFLIVTWAGNIREKRWDLVIKLIKQLCPQYKLAVVAYKGKVEKTDLSNIKIFQDSGSLYFTNDLISKDEYPRLVNRCRVMLIPSEWDNKPRIMDQAMLCNLPLAVNSNLYAGLKLVSQYSGLSAPPERLGECAIEVLKGKTNFPNPRKWYLENHGPYNACLRLTTFLNKVFNLQSAPLFPEDDDFMFTAKYMKAIPDLPHKPEQFSDPMEQK